MTTPTAKAPLMSRVAAGAAGGVAGGVAFGLLMQMMSMMPMVAMLAGSESLLVGWAVHLAISAVIGAAFGVVVPAVPVLRAVLMGGGYGAVWWVRCLARTEDELTVEVAPGGSRRRTADDTEPDSPRDISATVGWVPAGTRPYSRPALRSRSTRGPHGKARHGGVGHG